MSKLRKAVMQAAAGNAGEAVYVDDLFSTFLYAGTGSNAYPVQEIAITGNSVTGVTGLAFKSDGTKMYATSGVVAIPGILEFDLSTAWDVTTATYNQFGTTFDWCSDLWIDSTGTKVFVVSTQSDHIGYYTLSTAWDISTISSRVASRSTTGEGEGNPQFIFLKPDGTELYYGGTDTDNVFQLGLSTAFDLSTASHDATFYVGTQEPLPFALVFNSTGTRMFVIGNSNETVYQYNLSTAWDLTTASFNSSCPTGQNLTPSGMRINDGKLFIVFTQNPPQYKAYSMPDSDEISSVARNVITNGIDLAGEGGMIWTKERSPNARNHYIGDSERNNFRNYLYSNLGNAESGLSSAGFDISSVSSTGYNLGADNYTFNNESGSDQVSWTFRKQPGFFDVVTYTGDNTSNRVISHSLDAIPGLVVVKNLSRSQNWFATWLVDDLYSNTLYLSNAGTHGFNQRGYISNSQNRGASPGNDWTSTTVNLSNITASATNGTYGTNINGDNYVMYLWAAGGDAGFGADGNEEIIKVGAFTGNGDGSASYDGPTINLGFEPQWILFKPLTGTSNDKEWVIVDVMRGIATGGNDTMLFPNYNYSEDGYYGAMNFVDITSTGFKLTTGLRGLNFSGEEYGYVAIRRPHKPAEEFAATDLFSTALLTGTGSAQTITSGFPVDAFWNKTRGSSPVSFTKGFTTRLTKGYTDPSRTAGEVYSSSATLDVTEMNNTGVEVQNNSASNINYNGDIQVNWMFRRAPGFFDVVAYTGNGSGTHNVSHNLGVKPELVICKSRSTGNNWPAITDTSVSSAATLFLNTNSSNAGGSSSGMFTDTTVNVGSTAGLASLYTLNPVNASSVTYIMYLFASVAGISKVGTYSGTGSDVNVDCGFTSGARFVLVKRTDSTGDWYVWDSVRGIVAGNDPYLLFNATGAEVTSTDYIDPLSSGFTITSSAPAALNASGGNYIFLAIA